MVKHIIKQKTVKGKGSKESDEGTCILCNKEYSSLKKHEQIYHDDASSMDCPICKKVFYIYKNWHVKVKNQVNDHITLIHFQHKTHQS